MTAFVKGTGIVSADASTTVALPFGSAPAATTNTVIVSVACDDTGLTGGSFTDNQSGTYVIDKHDTDGGGIDVYIARRTNALSTGSTITVTVTRSAGTPYWSGVATEYSGVPASPTVTTGTSGSGTTQPFSAVTAGSLNAGDLVVSAVMVNDNTATQGIGTPSGGTGTWVKRAEQQGTNAHTGFLMADKVDGTGGAETATTAVSAAFDSRIGIIVGYVSAAGIAFDAAGNSGDQAATNTYSGGASWSGTSRLLAIDVSMLGAGVTVSSMTYGGAACTFVGAISTVTSFGRVEQWRIASSDSGAPATGSNTLVVNLSGSLEFTVEWASYTGVHQSSPTESFNSAQATNAGSATDASVAVTSIADNCWIHAAVVANDTSISAGNTTRNNVSGTLGSGANEDNNAPKTPAGSVTMSYSGMGLTTTWAIAGYAIRPLAATSIISFPPFRSRAARLATLMHF